MKKSLILLILVGQIASAMAQTKVFGGSGGFYFGGKFYDPASYQYFLPDQAESLGSNLITLGGGAMGVFNDWVVGGYGFYRGGDRLSVESNQIYSYSLNGGGGYFNIGYVIFQGADWLIYPLAGIGVEGLKLNKTIDEDVGYSPDQLLSAEYNWTSPMLEISLAYDIYPLSLINI